jgi:hypothetical protein
MITDEQVEAAVLMAKPIDGTERAVAAIRELLAEAWDEGIGQCCEVCFPPPNPYERPKNEPISGQSAPDPAVDR